MNLKAHWRKVCEFAGRNERVIFIVLATLGIAVDVLLLLKPIITRWSE